MLREISKPRSPSLLVRSMFIHWLLLDCRLSPLNRGLISIVVEAAPLSSKATRAEEQLEQQVNDLDLSNTPAQACSRDQDNASSAAGLKGASSLYCDRCSEVGAMKLLSLHGSCIGLFIYCCA